MTDETKATSKTVLKLSPVAASVVAALQPAGTALAQDNAEFTLDEIIVTATKRESNLQTLGQSISALSGTDIDKKAILSMEDLVASIPSVTIASSQPGRNTIIFRGMSTGTDEWRTDSPVAVYLDEQPMTAISQQIDPRMVDINRVEAMPGPQGTLFGASSTSGTLRIITNKPDLNEFSGAVEGTVKTTKDGDESYDINGHLNIPLSDQLGIRLVAYNAEEGGWVDNVLGTALTGLEDNAALVEDDFNSWKITGGRLTAKLEWNDEWSTLLTVMTQKTESTGAWGTDPALGIDEVTTFVKENRIDDWDTMALTIKGDLGFAEFTSSTSYVDRSMSYVIDNHVYDSYKSTAAHDCSYPGYPTTCYLGGLYDLDYIIGSIFNDQTQTRISQEIRLASTSDSRLQWMVGAFYEDQDDEWFYGSVTPGLGNTPAMAYANYWAYYYNYYQGFDIEYPLPNNDIWWAQEYSRNVKQKAVFGEMGFDITDALTVTVGGRWFENERYRYERNTFPQEFPDWGNWALNGIDEVDGKTDNTTYKIGATWQLSDDNMVYGLYSNGFRLGGNNSARASNAGFVEPTYEPDSMDNYEIGHKSTFLNGRLRVNTSVFHMVWDDIQLPRYNNNIWWQNGNLNGGQAEQTGVELSVVAAVTDRFKITTNLYGGDGEYTEDILSWDISNDDPNTPEIEREVFLDTPAGTPKPFAPDFKYTVGLEYMIPDAWAGGDLSFYYYINGQADSHNDRESAQNGTVDLPSWSTSNMTARWESGEGLELSLRVRNLFDERYVQSYSNDTDWQVEAYWPGETRFRERYTYNRPREISLQARYNF